MSDIAIRVRDLGKQYRLGVRRYDSLRERLTDWASNPGRTKRLSKQPENRIWALKDVSFDIKQGSVVGIIGRNGAGKSTLLKIMSRITRPTTGRVDVWGRVGALLEVGTGFHPELSGRENVFLNGAILGMSRQEIAAKFDEIVAFAEVDKFIDTPVKHYSSGMHVRLAFAVAAHLEPEILVVDEVLAVGDAEFQKKCLGRMNTVSREGRTVLFVSHNMASIAQLCQTGVLLNRGELGMVGDIHSVIDAYLNSGAQDQADVAFPVDATKIVQVERLQVLNEIGEPTSYVDARKPFQMVVHTLAHTDVRATVILALNTPDGVRVCQSVCADCLQEYTSMSKGTRQRFAVTFPGGLLNEGFYTFTVWVVPGNTGAFDGATSPLFRIENIAASNSFIGERKKQRGILRLPLAWQVERL